MGKEYGETAPFQYFISLSDPRLIESMRQGRRREFAAFAWRGEAPNPQDEATFERSKLRRELRGEPRHRRLREFHRELLRLRRTYPALARRSKEDLEVVVNEKRRVFAFLRGKNEQQVFAIFHFGHDPVSCRFDFPAGQWRKLLDSAAFEWCGPGTNLPNAIESHGKLTLTLNPESLALFARA
jgi:maltooligosyltrehalose trehalohydrolase